MSKIVHSTKHNETVAGLIHHLLEFAAIASLESGRKVTADEIYVNVVSDGAGPSHLMLREQILTDGSKVYDCLIS